MADGRTIDETSPFRIETLILVFIVLTSIFERFLHYLDHNLHGRTRKGLRHAVHYVEQELLALGFISLLLIVFEEYLLGICVDKDTYFTGKSSHHAEKESYKHSPYIDPHGAPSEEASHRKFMFRNLLSGGEDYTCKAGKEPLWSANTIHQTHILIFLVAVMHVFYATVSITLCLWRMWRWKKYDILPDKGLKEMRSRNLMYGRNQFEYWFWSFWAQFSPSVDKSLYLSMRWLFIQRLGFSEDFDFLTFVTSSLVEDFALVVGTDWMMWGMIALWILMPNLIMTTTALAVFVVLLAGTKLELVGLKLSQLAFLSYGDRSSAGVKSITAPNVLIKRSVLTIANKLDRISIATKHKRPNLTTQSLGVPRVEGSIDDLVRRAQSTRDHRQESSGVAVIQQLPPESIDKKTPGDSLIAGGLSSAKTRIGADEELDKRSASNHFVDNPNKSFSKEEVEELREVPDSANLFWFKKPQLILRAVKFVYFATAMAIAVVLFDWWQESTFVVDKIDFVGHNQTLTIVIVISVGVICLLQTSFLMLPTYALTKVAGSYSLETVLEILEKIKDTNHGHHTRDILADNNKHERKGFHPLETDRYCREKHLAFVAKMNAEGLEASTDKSSRSLIGCLSLKNEDRDDIMASSRLCVQSSAEDERSMMDERLTADGCEEAMKNEEIAELVKIFGSTDRFAEQMRKSQLLLKQIMPSAVFGFDCQTHSFNGRQMTKFDDAAISLAWVVIATEPERIGMP